MAGRPIEIVVDLKADGAERGATDIADSLGKVETALDDVQDKAQDAGKELEDALGDRATDGAADAVKSLDKLEDALDDVADKADDTGDELRKSIGDGADAGADDARASLKKVETALDDAGDKGRELDRDLTRALDDVKSSAADAGRGIDSGIRKGTDGAKAGLGEFRDEANSTAKESAASFDGSAESIVDVFQEVSANAFAGFGPAGAAAGLAAAVGIGIAIAKLDELAEANNEAVTMAAELGREMYEAGGQLERAAIADKIKDIAFALSSEDNKFTFWKDEAKTAISEVREALEGVEGVSAKGIFEALAGDVEAGQREFDRLTESIDRDRSALVRMTVTQGDHTQALTTEGLALEDSIDGRERLLKKITEASGAYAGASEDVAFYTDAMGKSTEATDEAADSTSSASDVADKHAEAMERVRAGVEATADAQRDLAGANMSVIETEIQVIEAFDKVTASVSENGQTLDLNTEQGRNNAGAVLDLVKAVNDQAQAEVDAGASVEEATQKQQAQRDVMVNQLMPAFGGSRDAAQAYIDKMLAVPKTVQTDVNLDGIPDAQQALDNFTRQRPTITVLSQLAVSRQEAYNQLNGAYGQHSFAVNINPRGGMQALP